MSSPAAQQRNTNWYRRAILSQLPVEGLRGEPVGPPSAGVTVLLDEFNQPFGTILDGKDNCGVIFDPALLLPREKSKHYR